MKKKEESKYVTVQLDDQVIAAVEAMRKESDPEKKKLWCETIREMLKTERDLRYTPKKESWKDKIDPNVLLTGGIALGEIVVILHGEKIGSMMNGRVAQYIPKLRNRA